jgi:hypothetical protein
MKARKLQVKVFAKDPANVKVTPLVPVFHEWIKRGFLAELLIDVVDYAHVHQGPSVLLVGHESDYCMDLGEGRPGLLYSRKRGGVGDPAGAVVDALRRALIACKALEDEGSLDPRLAFSGDRIEIRLNDRRLARNDEASFQEAKPVVETALGKVYGDLPFTVSRKQNDPRDLLTLLVDAPGAPGAGALAALLA